MRCAIMISLLVSGFVLGLSGPALADWETRSGDTIVVKSGETTKGDLWCSADTVIIDGTVAGDLLVYAAKVQISGCVEGNVIGLIAGTMTVSGKIGGNLRGIIANELVLNGSVGGNVSVMAMKLTLGRDASVGGLWSKGQIVAMNGTVNGRMQVSALEATIGGTVSGDSVVTAEEEGSVIHIRSGARLQSLSYLAPNAPRVDEGAVTGRVRKIASSRTPAELERIRIMLGWVWFLGTLIIGFVLIRLFPRRAAEWATGAAPLIPALFIGLGILVSLPLAAVLLFLTGLGIPLALLIGLIYLAMILVSPLPAYVYLGGALVRLFKLERQFPAFFLLLVGGAVTFLISTVPSGWVLVNLFATALGLGLLARGMGRITFISGAEGK